MKRLAIIIVTHNSESDIYECLDSVFQYSDLPKSELEVIVVDNASDHAESMFARLRKQYGDAVTLTKNTHNGGYGQGNNVGIRLATAPVILIMNPDVRLMEPVFAKALQAFDADASLCVYGMKQMRSATQPSRSSFSATYMMNGYLSTLLDAFCTRLDCYLPQRMYISGACFFLRKQPFEAIGMFDESNFMYGEEDDIRVRFMRQIPHCRIRYDKCLHYIHLPKKTKPTLAYQQKLLDAAIRNNLKHGHPAKATIKNRLRNANLLYARECLKGGESEYKQMLRDYRKFLQEKLKTTIE